MNSKLAIVSRIILLFMFLIILCIPAAHAGFEDLPVGARSNAFAGACVALANDPEALYINPAGLSQIEAFGTTLFYARPYGLKELAYGSLSAVVPTRGISLGMSIQSYGNSVYKENTFSSAVAHQLSRHLMIGATIRYAHLSIRRYGSSGTVALDVGLLLHLNPNWKWGFSSRNLNRSKIGQEHEPLPQIFQTGFSVKIADLIRLNCDVYKDVRFPLELRCGAEARPIQNLLLRLGFGTEPSRLAAGMGLFFGKLRWDYAFYTHSDLGLSHQMSISFFLNPNLEKPEP